ncbi:hypothetical protein P3719_23220 [Vibrio parahaemolyticus]|nr:hypothetical protein [Vibrio parahaemolyticus]MCA6691453.1 hypothetical protein [Vibrio parahaemolyticus]MDF5585788.1 hypothetical protein [Vibrio parahaemolyticus]MDF5590949.1 hypothetical protein [Vibrio parahaemolyticus]MDG2871750.1 hypothetical protein [Vibrio parahaemolyticus]
MSQIHERQYRLAREREIAAHRVRQTTQEYADRYEAILSDVLAQGLEEFVQSDYTRLRKQLNNLQRELHNDPFRAREISMSIGQAIHALPRNARSIRKEVEHAEHQAYVAALKDKEEKERQHKSHLLNVWQQELLNWNDKLSLNAVLRELNELYTTLFSSERSVSEDDIKTALGNLKIEAEQRAHIRREQINKQSQKEASAELAQVISEDIVKNLSQEKALGLTEQLELVRRETSDEPEKSQELLNEISKQMDTAIEEEAIRREMVKAVYKSLQEAGFHVQKPKLIKDKGKDEVLIAASRPAGNRALFQIELDGQCTYKFDNYKGQTCQKDIQQVLPKLTDIYGVDLSEERVLWSNPDNEDAEMKPIPSQTQRVSK